MNRSASPLSSMPRLALSLPILAPILPVPLYYHIVMTHLTFGSIFPQNIDDIPTTPITHITFGYIYPPINW